MLEENTSPGSTPLQPELQVAEQILKESIVEVCTADLRAADTGEMIRLDEMLAIASEAAKRAVSIRRRMRQERGGTSPKRARRKGAQADAGSTAAEPARDAAVPAASPTIADAPAGKPEAGEATGTEARNSEQAQQVGAEHRTFRDSNGVTWSVWAVHPQARDARHTAALPGPFLDGWLAFVCEEEKRRLSPVPEGWSTLDDAELERLCAAARKARQDLATRQVPRVEPGEGEARS